jgi:hypothetical protein
MKAEGGAVAENGRSELQRVCYSAKIPPLRFAIQCLMSNVGLTPLRGEKRMRYYAYRPDANTYAGIVAAPADHERVVNVHYQDASLAAVWSPISFHGFDDNPEEEGDFPSLSDFWEIPVFSRRAWDILRPLIGYCCEALPIGHPKGERFYIIHVMDTIDCVNIGRSVVERFSDGAIMTVKRYSLRGECLMGKHFFKLPSQSGRRLLLDDLVRETIENNGLKGLVFRELAMTTRDDDMH